MAKKAAKKPSGSKAGKSSAGKAGKASAKKAKPPPAEPKRSAILRELQDIIDLMIANNVTEVNVQRGGRKIFLRRGFGEAGAGSAAAASGAAAPPDWAAGAEELTEITSPMVGTFYAAPGPDSDPYASLGAHVNEETVVCIVEAMKVMNEIKADCNGRIAEICVKNAQPVEFGQVLFRVRPS